MTLVLSVVEITSSSDRDRSSAIYIAIGTRTLDHLDFTESVDELNVFAGDGHIAVLIEDSVRNYQMKRIVLNRKDGLFIGDERGGVAAVVLSNIDENMPPARRESATLPTAFADDAGESAIRTAIYK